ncbi:MAG: 50S ribosomal protein L11 [Candidatus Micrarchaeia archaeon]
MATVTVDGLVEGGKATPGPPLGPVLGPLGVNVKAVIDEINAKTKAYEGMKIPVKVIVDKETKKFEISVGTPPTSALIKKELGVEKGAKDRSAAAGDISLEQVIKIAKMKKESSLSKTLKSLAKEVLGTCVSLGVTCGGKNAREVIAEIERGEHEDIFKKEDKAEKTKR